MILRLNKPRVILGMPWLKKWNPRIDWNHLSMTLLPSPCHHIPYHAHYLGLDADRELHQLLSSLTFAKDDWSLCEYRLLAGRTGEQINKITISTQLTQANKPKEIPVPDFCIDFSDVFSEKTYNILPPHWSFEHTVPANSKMLSFPR